MDKQICENVSQLLDVPLECITESVFKNILSLETALQLHKYFKSFQTHVSLEKTKSLFQLIKQYKTRYAFIDETRRSTKQRARFLPLATEKSLNQESLVLGNCIQCGKIALLDDDPNQCNFCFSPIMKLGNFISQSSSDESFKRKNSELSDEVSPTENISLKEAKLKLNQLLEYQSTWYSHCHVYDDAVDWFRESNNIWLSEEQKDQMLSKAQAEEDQKQRRKTNNRKYVTIDLQNQQVFVSPSQDNIYIETPNDFLHKINLQNETEILKNTSRFEVEAHDRTTMSLSTLPAPLDKSCQEMYNYLQLNMIRNKNIPVDSEKKN